MSAEMSVACSYGLWLLGLGVMSIEGLMGRALLRLEGRLGKRLCLLLGGQRKAQHIGRAVLRTQRGAFEAFWIYGSWAAVGLLSC